MNWAEIKLTIMERDSEEVASLLTNSDFLNSDKTVLFNSAALLRKRKYYKEALRLIDGVYSTFGDGDRIRLSYLKGDILLDLCEYNDAVACYSFILENQKTDCAYCNRGLSFWSLREYEKALADYQSAMRLNPENAIACRGAGEMCLKLGSANDAVVFFEMAIKIDPSYIDALVGLGIAFYQSGEPVKSYEILLAAKQRDPANELANRGLKAIEAQFDL